MLHRSDCTYLSAANKTVSFPWEWATGRSYADVFHAVYSMDIKPCKKCSPLTWFYEED